MGIKNAVKKVGKVGGATLILGATGGVGAAAALAAKNSIEKTTYTVDRWGPLKEDKSMVGMHFSPSVALDTEDDVIISGTPFDGKHKVKRGRTRNDVWIKPGAPVTTSGTSGTFKVQTSVGARLRNLGSAGTAVARTATTKTAKAAKTGVMGGLGFIWNKIKKGLLILLAILIVFFIVKTFIGAKIQKAA